MTESAFASSNKYDVQNRPRNSEQHPAHLTNIGMPYGAHIRPMSSEQPRRRLTKNDLPARVRLKRKNSD
ncbi:hypothetical protein PF003_g8446 [Phytophthora fragariae]|nr:hypothetical protein PF003_g8446 [Phytophthora fragariae]